MAREIIPQVIFRSWNNQQQQDCISVHCIGKSFNFLKPASVDYLNETNTWSSSEDFGLSSIAWP